MPWGTHAQDDSSTLAYDPLKVPPYVLGTGVPQVGFFAGPLG